MPIDRNATPDPWAGLLGAPGDPCGYTHDEHVQDGTPLVCVRAAGHPGDEKVPARDQHLARVDGRPVFFGEPLVFEPEETP